MPLPGNATHSHVPLCFCDLGRDRGLEKGGLPDNRAPHSHPNLREREARGTIIPLEKCILGKTSLALSSGVMPSFPDLQD